MISEKERIEHSILEIIYGAEEPIGSGLISERLKALGFNVSEATIGRMLREYDNIGFTEKVGFKGRILTKKGFNRLKELDNQTIREHYGYELMNLLNVKKKEELKDILIARKAIERELARLAAENITPKEIEYLKEIIKLNEEHIKQSGSGADEDVKFHKIIAQAAKNKILKAAIDLIRQDAQLSPVLETIRKNVKGTVIEDHKKILKALEKRSPEEAEKAMVAHIEGLIKDVEKYWEITHNENLDG